MTDVFSGIIEEIERDIAASAPAVFRCYATKVRKGRTGVGGIPFDTGLLRAGLQLQRQSFSRGKATAEFASTTVARRGGFDYPAHLDSGGIHAGWWDKVNDEKILEDCANQILGGVGL